MSLSFLPLIHVWWVFKCIKNDYDPLRVTGFTILILSYRLFDLPSESQVIRFPLWVTGFTIPSLTHRFPPPRLSHRLSDSPYESQVLRLPNWVTCFTIPFQSHMLNDYLSELQVLRLPIWVTGFTIPALCPLPRSFLQQTFVDVLTFRTALICCYLLLTNLKAKERITVFF